MKVERLIVSGFRGISKPLEIALRSPVVVISAPNGTGKTSLCDAFEWLLTGFVARLHEARLDDPDGLRCWFGAHPTFVEAEVKLAGKTVGLRRELTEGNVAAKLRNGNRWRKTDPANFLAELVEPSAAPSAANTRQQNELRRDWLLATRYLAGSSLDLLIDSSQEGDSKRRLLFSSLLGVEHLYRSEEELESVERCFPPVSGIQAEIVRLQDALATSSARLSSLSAQSLEAAGTELRRELADVLLSLGVGSTAAVALVPLSNALQATFETRRSEHELRRTLVDSLSHSWAGREDLKQHVEELLRAAGDYERRARELFEKEQETRQLLQQAGARAVEECTSRDRSKATQAQLLGLVAQLEPRISEFRRALGTEFTGKRLGELERWQVQLKAVSERVDNQERLIEGYRRATAVLQQFRQAIAIQRQQEDTLAEIQSRIATSPGLAVMDAALREADARYRQLRNALGGLSGSIEALRNAANAAIGGGLANERSCPVCGHDHGTAESLRRAIQRTIACMPQEQQRLAQEVEHAQREAATLMAQRQQVQVLAEAFDRAVRDRGDTSARIEELRSKLATLGVDHEMVGAVDSDKRLQLAICTAEAELDSGRREQRQLSQLVEAEKSLREWAEHVGALMRSLAPDDVSRMCDSSVDRWASHIQRSISAAQQQVAARQDAAQKAIELQEQRKAALAQLAESRAQLKAAAEQTDERLSEASTRLAKVVSDWTHLAQDVPWTDEALASIKKGLDSEDVALAKADAVLRKSKGVLTAISEIAAQTSEVARLEGDLKRNKTRLEEWTSWKNEMQAARVQIQERRNAAVREQLQPIQDLINAIYHRAQASGVVDLIRAKTSAEGTIRWVAAAGDTTVEQMAELSSGQRQDLAVAVFLARALSLGGTFLLDEPLLHLDELNRVAIIDTLRTIALQQGDRMRVVLTTANEMLVDMFVEKFRMVQTRDGWPGLQVIELHGNCRSPSGVQGRAQA